MTLNGGESGVSPRLAHTSLADHVVRSESSTGQLLALTSASTSIVVLTTTNVELDAGSRAGSAGPPAKPLVSFWLLSITIFNLFWVKNTC